MIQFDWAWAFWALPLPALAWWLLPAAPVVGALALPIAGEFRALLGERTASFGRVNPAAFLAWLLLVTAAAQPRWIGEVVQLPVAARDLLLAIDISASMSENDITLGRDRITRFESVQKVVGPFIARREGDRVGLILFGSNAYVYTPLSLDRATVAQLLAEAEVGLAGDRTAIGDAISLGVKHLRDSALDNRVLILLTDGVNTGGQIAPPQAGRIAASAGVRVHTIGFGSESDASYNTLMRSLGWRPTIDEPQLRRIATETGGRYFRARTLAELAEVHKTLDRIEPVVSGAREFRPSRSLFHWPLAGALALALLLAALRGLRR
jgi:Ca-activated chloride channel homolog